MHNREDEWTFVLSGSGITKIDGHEYVLNKGDFLAFPIPSVAHIMGNRNNDDLIYMMGGENLPDEVADFLTLDRRMIKLNDELSIYTLSDGKAFIDNGD